MKRALKIFSFFILSAALGMPLPAAGHQESGPQPGTGAQPTIEDKTSSLVPLALSFRDEDGRTIRLRDIVSKPVILSLVYYTCEHICPQLLIGLAAATDKLTLSPRKDYQVIIISFDEADTPKTAADMRRNYLKQLENKFPGDSWRFLTGDRENIGKLTDAAGFSFKKEGHGFVHPSVLIILSPEGKVTRYIHTDKFQYGVAYPVNFSVFLLESAIKEASRGEVAVEKKGKVLFCFPGEPEGQAKLFRILNIAGSTTLLVLISLFVYLKWSAGRSRRKVDHDD